MVIDLFFKDGNGSLSDVKELVDFLRGKKMWTLDIYLHWSNVALFVQEKSRSLENKGIDVFEINKYTHQRDG